MPYISGAWAPELGLQVSISIHLGFKAQNALLRVEVYLCSFKELFSFKM